jgi:hypothetical protein
MPKIHFKEDSRYFIIAEDCMTMEEAEEAVDGFLQEISAMDEGGSVYQRIKLSGTKENEYFLFQVNIQ